MDHAVAAEKMSQVGEICVERVGVEPGMEVLDVACGAGNATIPAARAGARVTGLDRSSDLLAIARERAADAMVEIDWVEGDPAKLPFEDDSFDRVISIFGRPSLGEMRRVCRGRIGICSWTPTGAIGRMLGMVVEPAPPLPDAAVERRTVEWRDSSVESFAEFMLDSFGRLSAPEALAERAGELRAAFTTYLAAENLEDDGTLRFRGEYLVAVVS